MHAYPDKKHSCIWVSHALHAHAWYYICVSHTFHAHAWWLLYMSCMCVPISCIGPKYLICSLECTLLVDLNADVLSRCESIPRESETTVLYSHRLLHIISQFKASQTIRQSLRACLGTHCHEHTHPLHCNQHLRYWAQLAYWNRDPSELFTQGAWCMSELPIYTVLFVTVLHLSPRATSF